METEIFKDIPGYEGLYQASNMGNIKLFKLNEEKIIKLYNHTSGYLNVSIGYKMGGYKMKRVHGLVMLAFVGERPIKEDGKKYVINHKNGIKTDNRLDNLEYCTNSENQLHSYKELGRIAGMTGKTGKLCVYSKKVNQYTLEGEFIKTWDSIMDIKRDIGIYSVSLVCNGKLKTSGGFKWKFTN